MSITADEKCNPITVTGTCSSAEKVTDKMTYVKFIRWYKPTTVGHLLSVLNKNGNAITDAYCDVANVSQDIPIFTILEGIYIDDMDSGSLFIYTN